MHVQQHGVVSRQLNHVAQETVAVNVSNAVVHGGQEVYQLFQRRHDRAVLCVQTNDVLYVLTLLLSRLAAENLPRLLIEVIYPLTVRNYDSVGQ